MRQRNNHRNDCREQESCQTQNPNDCWFPLLHEAPKSRAEHQEANRDADDGENHPSIHLLSTPRVTRVSAAFIAAAETTAPRNRDGQ